MSSTSSITQVWDASGFTRRAEIEEYASERGIGFADAVRELVNRSLSLPDPEPSLGEKLRRAQADISAATDSFGWADPNSGEQLAAAGVELGRAVGALVGMLRGELRRAVA